MRDDDLLRSTGPRGNAFAPESVESTTRNTHADLFDELVLVLPVATWQAFRYHRYRVGVFRCHLFTLFVVSHSNFGKLRVYFTNYRLPSTSDSHPAGSRGLVL